MINAYSTNLREKLQKRVTAVNSTCEKYNLKINIAKTEGTLKMVRLPRQHDIHINNLKVKQPPELKNNLGQFIQTTDDLLGTQK